MANQNDELAALLVAHTDAWNRHDIDRIMGAMTEDCIFVDSTGFSHESQNSVLKIFSGIFEVFPDAQWENSEHFVSGSRGLTEWVFTGTEENGKRSQIPGCDVFTFRENKIAVKNTYLK